jgi:hypothetical protein
MVVTRVNRDGRLTMDHDRSDIGLWVDYGVHVVILAYLLWVLLPVRQKISTSFSTFPPEKADVGILFLANDGTWCELLLRPGLNGPTTLTVKRKTLIDSPRSSST